MKKIITLCAWTVLIIAIAVPAGANAIIGDNLRLHIPWIIAGEDVYSMDLDIHLEDPMYCTISDLKLRNITLSSEVLNAAAVFLGESQILSVPRASYGGRIYKLNLSLASRNGLTVFDIISITNADTPAKRGTIISSTLIDTLSVDDITALLPAGASSFVQLLYSVSLYKIVYTTVDPYGNATNATGLLATPDVVGLSLPFISYQHGTAVVKASAPSEDSTSDGYLVATLMASEGYLAIAPDYLGMGQSFGLHPYMHAKSSATAVVDMMRAAKIWADNQKVNLNGKTFLTGYSEGGFVTMAATREIEFFHAEEFNLTAVAPMAGPYSISGVMMDIIKNQESVINPYYFPYSLLAANNVYGLIDNYDDLFASPYSSTIPPLYDGMHSSGQINSELPSIPYNILSPVLIEQYGNDDNAPINLSLKDNDLIYWTPKVEMNLYHCLDDKQVPFANSQIAYDSFIKNGATGVTLIPLTFGSHTACAIPAMMLMNAWFETK